MIDIVDSFLLPRADDRNFAESYSGMKGIVSSTIPIKMEKGNFMTKVVASMMSQSFSDGDYTCPAEKLTHIWQRLGE